MRVRFSAYLMPELGAVTCMTMKMGIMGCRHDLSHPHMIERLTYALRQVQVEGHFVVCKMTHSPTRCRRILLTTSKFKWGCFDDKHQRLDQRPRAWLSGYSSVKLRRRGPKVP